MGSLDEPRTQMSLGCMVAICSYHIYDTDSAVLFEFSKLMTDKSISTLPFC